MLLFFAEKAYVDDQKLTGYCLPETHTIGKHKARVFKSVLGLSPAHSQLLKEAILTAVLMNEARQNGPNQQGIMYEVDFSMTRDGQTAVIRTAWIVRFTESFPRLVGCYIKL